MTAGKNKHRKRKKRRKKLLSCLRMNTYHTRGGEDICSCAQNLTTLPPTLTLAEHPQAQQTHLPSGNH